MCRLFIEKSVFSFIAVSLENKIKNYKEHSKSSDMTTLSLQTSRYVQHLIHTTVWVIKETSCHIKLFSSLIGKHAYFSVLIFCHMDFVVYKHHLYLHVNFWKSNCFETEVTQRVCGTELSWRFDQILSFIHPQVVSCNCFSVEKRAFVHLFPNTTGFPRHVFVRVYLIKSLFLKNTIN